MVFWKDPDPYKEFRIREAKTFGSGTLIELTTVVWYLLSEVTYFLAVFGKIYVLARFLLNLMLIPNNVLGW
jgi:hypothetical protein